MWDENLVITCWFYAKNCMFERMTDKILPPPALDRSYSPPQTASGSSQPFCHSTLSGHMHRHTDRQMV